MQLHIVGITNQPVKRTILYNMIPRRNYLILALFTTGIFTTNYGSTAGQCDFAPGEFNGMIVETDVELPWYGERCEVPKSSSKNSTYFQVIKRYCITKYCCSSNCGCSGFDASTHNSCSENSTVSEIGCIVDKRAGSPNTTLYKCCDGYQEIDHTCVEKIKCEVNNGGCSDICQFNVSQNLSYCTCKSGQRKINFFNCTSDSHNDIGMIIGASLGSVLFLLLLLLLLLLFLLLWRRRKRNDQPLADQNSELGGIDNPGYHQGVKRPLPPILEGKLHPDDLYFAKLGDSQPGKKNYKKHFDSDQRAQNPYAFSPQRSGSNSVEKHYANRERRTTSDNNALEKKDTQKNNKINEDKLTLDNDKYPTKPNSVGGKTPNDNNYSGSYYKSRERSFSNESNHNDVQPYSAEYNDSASSLALHKPVLSSKKVKSYQMPNSDVESVMTRDALYAEPDDITSEVMSKNSDPVKMNGRKKVKNETGKEFPSRDRESNLYSDGNANKGTRAISNNRYSDASRISYNKDGKKGYKQNESDELSSGNKKKMSNDYHVKNKSSSNKNNHRKRDGDDDDKRNENHYA